MNRPLGPGPLATAWVVLVALRFLFHHEINDRLWALSLLVDAGLILFAIGIVAACLAPTRVRARWPGAALLLAAVLALWPLQGGAWIGTWSKFLREHRTYDRTVREFLSLPPDEQTRWNPGHPSTYVDEGPPVRLAFSWGGLLDNWKGVVYDPDGSILRQSGASGSQAVVFGATLVRATHLQGPWYFCVFT